MISVRKTKFDNPISLSFYAGWGFQLFHVINYVILYQSKSHHGDKPPPRFFSASIPRQLGSSDCSRWGSDPVLHS